MRAFIVSKDKGMTTDVQRRRFRQAPARRAQGAEAMKSFHHAGLLLSPLIVFWEVAGFGQPLAGAAVGALAALALGAWTKRRREDLLLPAGLATILARRWPCWLPVLPRGWPGWGPACRSPPDC
jgi:hypothetical protein